MDTATPTAMAKKANLRHLGFAGLGIVLILVLHNTFVAWLRLAWHNEEYSFLWIIPLISASLSYWRRREVFAKTETAPDGAALIAVGATLCVLARVLSPRLEPINDLTVAVAGVVAFEAGVFRLCYGRQAWRAERFPLAFLLFMIPLPTVLLSRIIACLQAGSAAVVDGIFSVLQISFWRNGLQFDLRGLQIEIAPECSGI
jgi:exosortase